MNLDIIVVANHHRKALILNHLNGITHKVSYTPDYTLPKDFKPTVSGLVQPWCHLGVYRCFKGHQDAIKMCEKDNVMIFEDDAVPNNPDWINIVADSISLLDTFEMVSFHGRCYDRPLYKEFKEIRPGNNFLYIPNKSGRICVHGALAYMLNRRTFDRVLSWEYIGDPIDTLLVNSLNFCLLEKSPFDHDRSEGSLLDV